MELRDGDKSDAMSHRIENHVKAPTMMIVKRKPVGDHKDPPPSASAVVSSSASEPVVYVDGADTPAHPDVAATFAAAATTAAAVATRPLAERQIPVAMLDNLKTTPEDILNFCTENKTEMTSEQFLHYLTASRTVGFEAEHLITESERKERMARDDMFLKLLCECASLFKDFSVTKSMQVIAKKKKYVQTEAMLDECLQQQHARLKDVARDVRTRKQAAAAVNAVANMPVAPAAAPSSSLSPPPPSKPDGVAAIPVRLRTRASAKHGHAVDAENHHRGDDDDDDFDDATSKSRCSKLGRGYRRIRATHHKYNGDAVGASCLFM